MSLSRAQVQILADSLAASAVHNTPDGKRLLAYLMRLLIATISAGPRAVLFCDVSGVDATAKGGAS